jgi:hypothetical protein
MRRFITLLDPLIFGIILGMIFVAISHARPAQTKDPIEVKIALWSCQLSSACYLKTQTVRLLSCR